MVSSVSSSSSASTQTTSSASSKLSQNYTMFLKLLTTQIKTQNPLDPMDSSKFTQQLATYSALEQQIASNKKLDALLTQFKGISTTLGSNYIGKTITANSSTLTIDANGKSGAAWSYKLDKAASKVALTVVNSNGKTVWSGTGEASSGSHAFKWDGKDNKGNPLPAGDYRLKVTATDAKKAKVTSSVSISGKVTASSLLQGNAYLELGNTKVKLSAASRISA